MFPKLEKYHSWWYTYRDIDQNGWCEFGSCDASLTAAKWESGMDNAVRFDSAAMLTHTSGQASLNQESVDLNAFLMAEKLILAKIAEQLGYQQKQAKYLKEEKDIGGGFIDQFYHLQKDWFFDSKVGGDLIEVAGPKAGFLSGT